MKTERNTSWDLAPAPENRSHARIAESYGLFINGRFQESKGDRFNTINPATEEALSQVPESNASDIDKAVKAARKAFKVWSTMPGAERGKYIFRVARMIQEKARELADHQQDDDHQPIRQAGR